MQFIAVRHAATEFNVKELINGTIDEDLSTEGQAQVDELIKILADYTFTVVYTSPLKRAEETAIPVAIARHVPIKKDPRITEVDLGSFNGQGWNATIPVFGLNSSQLLSSVEYDFRAFGGESAEQTQVRVQSFLDDLKKEPGEVPLVVTHGGVLRWFHYLCTGEKAGRIPNLSVFTFTL